MASSKLSDTMIRVLLEALTRRSTTDDGTVVYQVSCSASTARALEARGKVETAHKVVRTPGINDGVSYQAVAVWLTAEGVTFLREALTVVVAKRGNDRNRAYQDVINTSPRQARAVAAFLLGDDVDAVETVGRNRDDASEDFRETLTVEDAVAQLGDILRDGLASLSVGSDGRISQWVRMSMNIAYIPLRGQQQGVEEVRRDFRACLDSMTATNNSSSLADLMKRAAELFAVLRSRQAIRGVIPVAVQLRMDYALATTHLDTLAGYGREVAAMWEKRCEERKAAYAQLVTELYDADMDGVVYDVIAVDRNDVRKERGAIDGVMARRNATTSQSMGAHVEGTVDMLIIDWRQVPGSKCSEAYVYTRRTEGGSAPASEQTPTPAAVTEAAHSFAHLYRQEVRNGAGELSHDAAVIEGEQAERIVGHHTTASVSYRPGGVIVVTKSPTNVVGERTVVLTPLEPSDVWDVKNTAGEWLATVEGVFAEEAQRAAYRLTVVQETAEREGGVSMRRRPRPVAAAVAPEARAYTWADVRSVPAAVLAVGDVFVVPAAGVAHVVRPDGTVTGAGVAWGMVLDGVAWTVVEREGDAVTARNASGERMTEVAGASARVLRVKPVEPSEKDVKRARSAAAKWRADRHWGGHMGVPTDADLERAFRGCVKPIDAALYPLVRAELAGWDERIAREESVAAPVAAVEPLVAPEGPAVAVGTVQAPWEVYGHRVYSTGASVPLGSAEWTVAELRCVDCGRTAHLTALRTLGCTQVRELAAAERLAMLSLPQAAGYEHRVVRCGVESDAQVLTHRDAVALLAAEIVQGGSLRGFTGSVLRVGFQGHETSFRPLAG
ncbi:hypothetical protein ACWGQT_07370 [Streptomyces yangpuensis]